MPAAPLHVVIIGAGLGGLCLAQGLRKAGISVAVYERDRTPTDRLQGYRIHIEPLGNQALAACLPAALFDRYLATSGSAGSGYRIGTDQLKPLVFFPAPVSRGGSAPDRLSRSVSRITLREVLLSGLDDVVHFDKTYTHYDETPGRAVTACFADGTRATADVLVAADGGNSRVRQQRLPHARHVETGVVAIMGKLALTEEARNLLVPGRLDGATSILGPKGHAMFIALHDLGSRPPGAGSMYAAEAAARQQPGLLFDDARPYLFWAFLARRQAYPVRDDPRQMDGAALQQVVLQLIQAWHPHLQRLVGASDASTIIAKSLHTAVPIKPWETRRITLLGDAIHSMPPTRGIGGNTALRDAQLLYRQMIAAQSGEQPLLQAIHAYEREMARAGFAAVRGSLQALNLHVASSRRMATLLLRSMNVLFALQRRATRTPPELFPGKAR